MAQSGWVPETDVFEVPDADKPHALICDHITRINIRASPGFDIISALFIKHAVKVVRVEGSNKPQHVNMLAPYFTRLFAMMMELASIPAYKKEARLRPLYKKGLVLDPGNYRMLAVSGTLYRLYANVLRDLVTSWCEAKKKIPDMQFGSCPRCNTLQPMFILRYLQHAAQAKRPSNSPKLHAAFIDFKQAYDTIPRESLWDHLHCIRMLSSLLNIEKDLNAEDGYIIVDGPKHFCALTRS